VVAARNKEIKMEALKKLVKASESFSVYMYDNGYMVEVGGRNKSDDWVTCKVIIKDVAELHAVVDQITQLPKED
jgi:hypothetical protein